MEAYMSISQASSLDSVRTDRLTRTVPPSSLTGEEPRMCKVESAYTYKTGKVAHEPPRA